MNNTVGVDTGISLDESYPIILYKNIRFNKHYWIDDETHSYHCDFFFVYKGKVLKVGYIYQLDKPLKESEKDHYIENTLRDIYDIYLNKDKMI